MKWRIKNFTVRMGDDLSTSYLYQGSCIAEITCESQIINTKNQSTFSSRHECWICFVEGTLPDNIKDRGIWVYNTEGVAVTLSKSVLFLNIQQHSIADYLSILTTNEAYIVDRDSDNKIHIIGETSYLEVISTEPSYGAADVIDNHIKIIFNEYLQPANNYDEIYLNNLTASSRLHVPITKTLNENTLIIYPESGSFSRGTEYGLNIPQNSIKSQDGDYITQSYNLKFTTRI